MKISQFNPVARILALMLFTTPLMLSVDIVSAGVALAFCLIVTPVLGVSYRQLLARSWPVLLITPISGLSMALYGRPEGTEYFSWFAIHITDHSLQLAAAIMVRVLAIALPAILLLGKLDPTEVGDALTQKLHFPQRFVIGAVAGGRLVSLFRRDWETMRRSRRIRGIDAQGKLRMVVTMTFGLLVLALRRGAKLATAMEARGFGRFPTRTHARVSVWHTRDTVLLLCCSLASASAIIVAIYLGSYRFLGA
ncbi:energy-coupling factor transporter transmembrane protein EcfT [Corynebacterium sp. HS2168-gen11]|uniref:energy-coupling factor transporter transmembrane component T family protein n=1 Tax=Corynebacterium sp. HS2168-gen11 TaxID=2974027 RepID=UPI00216B2966|nr:energy-coupling factor transporter transmembrane component T [Corynebacterium sp. HS2168-gen11]MCS4534944.1 energy-coupling factor transporter transmembrane protein EcfT [Corynebacterium sp. HS2168-gen11]